VGDPVADGPSADVALKPSLVIDEPVKLLLILTVKLTWTFPPFGTVKPDQVTVPETFVPP
jgi:hypothetical protein